MPQPTFFKHLGLFFKSEFLDQALCIQLCEEMQSSQKKHATIRSGSIEIVDQQVRRTSVADVSPGHRNHINKRLEALKPELQAYFGMKLKGYETPQFLTYKKGGFYKCHQDSTTDEEAPGYFQSRKVSIVIFLNAASNEIIQQTFSGGELTFYGLMSSPPWNNCGLPLTPDEGLLVAFRSEIVHEVTPVTVGNRYTIVTWYW